MKLPATRMLLTMLAMLVLSTRQAAVRAFQTRILASTGTQLLSSAAARSQRSALQVHTDRDADLLEMLVGGERYSMIPMPDSMVSNTLFVGNLCEFVDDDQLSNLFQRVSVLQSVPACVARKPNMASMQYGFVSFPTEQEKNAAILHFNGLEWKGKRIKVEPIRDHPSFGRVRVPEKLVAYVSGGTKKTRSGKPNTLRRISRDDVDRLSRGQPSKRKGYGSRNVLHRLNEQERGELDRAEKKGFLVLSGSGSRRTRKGSPLANIHRQWCDARGKPQIIVFKAMRGQVVDEVLVDLSPLRLNGLFDCEETVDDFLVKWKAEILAAANDAGMDFRDPKAAAEDDACQVMDESLMQDLDEEEEYTEDPHCYTVTLDADTRDAWATKPIWRLPVVSMGVFLGERSRAKAMAKQLALLWDIPEKKKEETASTRQSRRKDVGANKGGRTKGLREHRRRGGGHRQAW